MTSPTSKWLDAHERESLDCASAAGPDALHAAVEALFEEKVGALSRFSQQFSEERNAAVKRASNAEAQRDEALHRLDALYTTIAVNVERATKAEALAEHLKKHLAAEEGERVRETKALREQLEAVAADLELTQLAFVEAREAAARTPVIVGGFGVMQKALNEAERREYNAARRALDPDDLRALQTLDFLAREIVAELHAAREALAAVRAAARSI